MVKARNVTSHATANDTPPRRPHVSGICIAVADSRRDEGPILTESSVSEGRNGLDFHAPVGRLTLVADRPAPAEERKPRTLRNTFLGAWIAPFCLSGLWSLATAPLAGPDESAHIVKAAAVVRGDLYGTDLPAHRHRSAALQAVTVPRFFAQKPLIPCFAVFSTKAPSCFHPRAGSSAPTSAATYVGRYPPTYYLLVGLPSLVATSWHAVMAMRLVSALVGSAFLALAVAVARRFSNNRLLLVAILLAVVPTVVSLNGVVNPNGLEASAALCYWCSGAVLLARRRHEVPRPLLAVVATSGAALALTRPLSPAWLAVITFLLLLSANRSTLADLARVTGMRVVAATLAATAAGAALWDGLGHALLVLPSISTVPKGEGTSGLLAQAVRSMPTYWHQVVGQFNWCLGLLNNERSIIPLGAALLLGVALGWLLTIAVARTSVKRIALLVGLPILASWFGGSPRGACKGRRLFVAVASVAVLVAQQQLLRRAALEHRRAAWLIRLLPALPPHHVAPGAPAAGAGWCSTRLLSWPGSVWACSGRSSTPGPPRGPNLPQVR